LGPHLTGKEIEMIGAGVDFAFAARADDVTRRIPVVAKERAAAMHALFLVSSEGSMLPRSLLESWVRPRLQFADVLDRIGAFPASERTRKELLVGALSPRQACTSALD
jgi:hypothetical protein